MHKQQAPARSAHFPGRWGCSLLLLLSLAACGASGQPAAPAPTDVPATPPAPATSDAATPTSAPAAETTEPPPTQPPTEPPPTEPPRATAVRRPTAAAPTSAPAAAEQWQTYHNQQAGYRVAYPPGWRATELTAAPEQLITSFGPGGEAGISVAVQTPDPEQREPIDLPVGRCKPITVGGASAMRCFDTVWFRAPKVSAGGWRQFVITVVAKRLDPAVFQHFLDSFAFD